MFANQNIFQIHVTFINYIPDYNLPFNFINIHLTEFLQLHTIHVQQET